MAATPDDSSATSVERWPSPSIRYWVTRMGAAYTGPRLLLVRSDHMPRETRTLTVVGAGYVGLVSAVGLAGLGHAVRLVETGSARLGMLRRGSDPHPRGRSPGGVRRGRGCRPAEVAGDIGDGPAILLVCVGTPIDDHGASDLTPARQRARGDPRPVRAGRHPRHPEHAPGRRHATRSSRRPGCRQPCLHQPGVPAPGHRARRLRCVRAGSSIGRFPRRRPDALDAVMSLYDSLGAPRQVVDVEAAEIIKNGANAFLALKLSFTNEIACLCEEAGADVDEVLAGIGADPRIGRTYMQPSFGFGGSCLPKELTTLAVAGRTLGLPMHVTAAASAANRRAGPVRRPHRVGPRRRRRADGRSARARVQGRDRRHPGFAGRSASRSGSSRAAPPSGRTTRRRPPTPRARPGLDVATPRRTPDRRRRRRHRDRMARVPRPALGDLGGQWRAAAHRGWAATARRASAPCGGLPSHPAR